MVKQESLKQVRSVDLDRNLLEEGGDLKVVLSNLLLYEVTLGGSLGIIEVQGLNSILRKSVAF